MINQAGIELLPYEGSVDAPIVVVCDPPSIKNFNDRYTMNPGALRLFVKYAEKVGFDGDDFVFVSPCEPIPERARGSDARERNHLRANFAAFMATMELFDPECIITLGKHAIKQASNRPVKIMKVRGQAQEYPTFPTIPVLPMISPAQVIRLPDNLEMFETDFHMLRQLDENDYDMYAPQFSTKDVDYEWVFDLQFLIDKIEDGEVKVIAVDCEATGLDWYRPEVYPICVQICYDVGKAVAVPLLPEYWNFKRAEYEEVTGKSTRMLTPRIVTKIRSQLRQIMEDPRVYKAGHNCVTGDTEVLTPAGWVRFDELQDGVDVMQADPESGELSFVTPSHVIRKRYDGLMYEWSSMHHDACYTPDHRMLSYTTFGKPRIRLAKEAASLHPNRPKVPTSGRLEGSDKVPLAWVQLLEAVRAAGSVESSIKGTYVRFKTTKARKIERLRYLAEVTGCDFVEQRGCFVIKGTSTALGWVCGTLGKGKNLGPWVWSLTYAARQAWIDELRHWDACSQSTKSGTYKVSTARKDHADWLQAVAISCGRRINFSEVGRAKRHNTNNTNPVLYRATVSDGSPVKAGTKGACEIHYSGMVYCVTVPTGAFVMRRNGKAVITGNCKIDHHYLGCIDIQPINWALDTMLLAFLVDENMPEKSLDECVRRWVPAMRGYADQFNATTDKSRMIDVALEPMLTYGCGDVDATLRLAKVLWPLVKQDGGQLTCYQKIMMPVMSAFMDTVEPQGMDVDVDRLAELQEALTDMEAGEYQELIKQVPRAVRRAHLNDPKFRNKEPKDVLKFSRPDFVRDIIFGEDGFNLTPRVFTKSTQNLPDNEKVPSTSAKDHLPYFEDHLFVGQFMNYQRLSKMRGTYVGEAASKANNYTPTGFWKYVHNGKIHPSFLLHRTVTGRCLTKDARVVTNRGSMTMQEIGEFMRASKTPVKALTHKNLFRDVTAFIPNGSKQVFKVTTDSGKQLKATENHPLWTDRGWVEVSDISVGDRTYAFDFIYNDGTQEDWREVCSDPRYKVSNHGRVWFSGSRFKKPGYVRPTAKGLWGHVKVKVGEKGSKVDLPVHIAVCTAFHGVRPDGMQVLHLNGIPADNRASNLRWGTSQENADLMVAHGRSRRGERSNQCKLTDEQLAQAKVMREQDGMFYGQIAERFEVSETVIRLALQGKRHKPYVQPFALETIASIEPCGVEQTYDLTVDQDHSFIAEGFVVHNSASANPNAQNFPKRGRGNMAEVVKAFRRVFVAPPGWKIIECVAEGSLVNTVSGLTPIEQITVGDYVETDKGPNQVLNTRKVGERKTLRVRASDGSHLDTTYDHPFLAVRDGAFDWLEAQNLEASDYLVARHRDVEYRNAQKSDEAYWAGLFCGDGCYGKPRVSAYDFNVSFHVSGGFYHLNFSFGDDADALRPLADSFFHCEGSDLAKGDSSSSSYHGNDDWDDWNYWNMRYPKDGAAAMRVPEIVLSGPDQYRASFLAGAIDAAGSYQSQRMMLCSISEKFIRDIHTLARSLGIHGVIRQTEIMMMNPGANGAKSVWYFDVFDRASLQRIPEGLIPRKSALKRAMQEGKTYTTCRTAMVPYSLIGALKQPGMQSTPKSNRLFSNGRKKGRCTVHAIKEAVAENPACEPLLALCEYRYFAVDGVDQGPEVCVYDLEVEHRHCFEANGLITHNCDLSQIELRLVAWTARDRTMLGLYNNGADIHAMTAASTMGMTYENFMDLDKKTRSMKRFQAKAVNFGFIYGMWWRKFMVYAKTEYGLDYTQREAQHQREVFFDTYSGIDPWHREAKDFTHEHGFIRALHGAVRHLPNIWSPDQAVVKECERQAVNSPIQRFGSDLGLMALSRLARDCPPELIRPIAFIHDALVCLVREDYADEAMAAVKFYMESNPLEEWFGLTPPLPILADASIGDNMADMEEMENVQTWQPDWYQPWEDGRADDWVKEDMRHMRKVYA